MWAFLIQVLLAIQFVCLLLKFKSILFLINHFKPVVARDARALCYFLQIQWHLRKAQLLDKTVHQVFEETTQKHPNKVCFRQDDQSWTFRQLSRYSNQVGNCFLKLGFRAGDEVALMMENRPEYIAIWLGLAKIGVVPALVNNHQRDKALVHAITCVNAKAVIFGTEFTKPINDVIEDLKEKRSLQYFCFGEPGDDKLPKEALSLEALIDAASAEMNKFQGHNRDTCAYIYTSGTTGLPKASKIRHCRIFMGAVAQMKIIGLCEKDTIYCALPFYHASGCILGFAPMIFAGATVVSRKKFSASQFWHDCIKYDCTAVIYIGELCRYLVNQPVRPEERMHKVRLFFGNGLRSNLWQPIQKRFGVKKIMEYFASTEGNTQIINYSNKEGACGFLPQTVPDYVWQTIYPVKLVKYDENKGEVVRGPNGFCVFCKAGETGMLLCNINNNDPLKAFDGYTNAEETQKKILKDAFKKGDQVFLSGDLLYMDDEGFLYFRDRVGDTFRWKGENVSTTEVETIISSLTKMTECVCYGVELPGYEGRACMVSIVEDKNSPLDLQNLLQEMKVKLPSYAVPIFIRMISQVDYTATFKLQKIQLKKQAFDLDVINDKVYLLDGKRKSYELLDKNTLEDIRQCNVRF